MPRNKDVLWEYIIQDGRKVKCIFCHEIFVGGVTRMRYHFANTRSKDIRPCKAVPDSVHEIALKGVQELESKTKRRRAIFRKPGDSSFGAFVPSGDANNVAIVTPQSCNLKQKPICSLTRKMDRKEVDKAKMDRKEVDKAIVKYIVNSNLTFDLLRSSEFREVCIAIANSGPGYEPPSSEHACAKLLAELKDEADVHVRSVKRMWEKSGCTLMLNSWSEGRDMPYLNVFAASPKGVVFLKSLCTVGHTTDDQYIFDFVSSVIDEIGSQNVVQVMSDNSSNYESICHMIEQKYPNIFKVNCATYCVHLMLKELESSAPISPILDGAKKIVNFVHKHQHVLNLLRTHKSNCDLKRPGTTRFPTNFIHLQSLLNEEQFLCHIVGTVEWRDLIPCKTIEGIDVQNIIQEGTFWDCAKELMHAVEPLFKILALADGGGSTSGYIYDAVRKAKEAVKEVFGANVKQVPICKIIDDNWNNVLYSDIHAAAAYLNPHLFHDGHVKLDAEIKVGLEKAIRKMVSNNEERIKIAAELRDYHSLDSRIFGLMAIDSLHVSHPRIWWDMWGSSVPILQSLAIKVLSQPCSFFTCDKKWFSLDATYTRKRNHLETISLQDLLYVRMNTHLMKSTPKTEKADLNPIDFDKIDAFRDEFEEIDLQEDREDSDDKEEDEGEESE
ncbi:Uncharacterized protein M6B38_236415 [Iris pallida]|uniref:BED-type domain-containing protein n=1 Tax=Iris pallida TaxID=29817 RepID=A0AAX6DP00_IRIPA|nr:Uncharacterized protein M6B38_236415 [Iris pallida]